MLNIDEKYFYPMGKPSPEMGMFPPPPHPHPDHPPHHPPHDPHHHAIPEAVEMLMAEVRATTARLLEFERRLEEKYDDMSRTLTSDNVLFKNTFAEAHRQFIQDVKNEVNLFEGNINASLMLFRKTLEAEVLSRLEKQDETIADSVAHMKTNLADTVDGVLEEMEASGELAEVINDSLNYNKAGYHGAVGDGATDDTEAIQKAVARVDTIDLGGKEYLVTTPIYLRSNITIKNGTIIGSNLSNIFVAEGTTDNPIHTVKIEGVTFDGFNNCAGGVFIRYGENVTIDECEFRNFYSETETAHGVHLRNCTRSIVKNSDVHNIEAKPDGSIGNGVGAARGILFTDTVGSTIENCTVGDIVSAEDGDGVHIASYENTMLDIDCHVSIVGVVFGNISRSAIKIQQSGVTIENCVFSATTRMEYDIRSYASNVVIKNNVFASVVTQPIYIGSNGGDIYANYIIDGNKFSGEYTDYQGCINVGDGIHVKGLIVANNVASLGEEIYFVYLRGWCEDCEVHNNIVNKCNALFYFRKPTNDTTALLGNRNFVIANNSGTCYWYVARFDDCATIYKGIVVTGNTFEYLRAQNAMYRYTVYMQSKVFSKYPLVRNNRVTCVGGVTIYDGYIQRDVASLRPVEGVHVGDTYFDTEANKVWYCTRPAQYTDDGIRTATATWI